MNILASTDAGTAAPADQSSLVLAMRRWMSDAEDDGTASARLKAMMSEVAEEEHAPLALELTMTGREAANASFASFSGSPKEGGSSSPTVPDVQLTLRKRIVLDKLITAGLKRHALTIAFARELSEMPLDDALDAIQRYYLSNPLQLDAAANEGDDADVADARDEALRLTSIRRSTRRHSVDPEQSQSSLPTASPNSFVAAVSPDDAPPVLQRHVSIFPKARRRTRINVSAAAETHVRPAETDGAAEADRVSGGPSIRSLSGRTYDTAGVNVRQFGSSYAARVIAANRASSYSKPAADGALQSTVVGVPSSRGPRQRLFFAQVSGGSNGGVSAAGTLSGLRDSLKTQLSAFGAISELKLFDDAPHQRESGKLRGFVDFSVDDPSRAVPSTLRVGDAVFAIVTTAAARDDDNMYTTTASETALRGSLLLSDEAAATDDFFTRSNNDNTMDPFAKEKRKEATSPSDQAAHPWRTFTPPRSPPHAKTARRDVSKSNRPARIPLVGNRVAVSSRGSGKGVASRTAQSPSKLITPAPPPPKMTPRERAVPRTGRQAYRATRSTWARLPALRGRYPTPPPLPALQPHSELRAAKNVAVEVEATVRDAMPRSAAVRGLGPFVIDRFYAFLPRACGDAVVQRRGHTAEWALQSSSPLRQQPSSLTARPSPPSRVVNR